MTTIKQLLKPWSHCSPALGSGTWRVGRSGWGKPGAGTMPGEAGWPCCRRGWLSAAPSVAGPELAAPTRASAPSPVCRWKPRPAPGHPGTSRPVTGRPGIPAWRSTRPRTPNPSGNRHRGAAGQSQRRLGSWQAGAGEAWARGDVGGGVGDDGAGAGGPRYGQASGGPPGLLPRDTASLNTLENPALPWRCCWACASGRERALNTFCTPCLWCDVGQDCS